MGMRGGFDFDAVQRIRDFPIEQIIHHYYPATFRRSGGNYFALCPFHQERTPSFSYHAEKNLWHCFGCGLGGDALGFVMEKENKSFPEAVREICEIFNIPYKVSPWEQKRIVKKITLKELYEDVATYFHKKLFEKNQESEEALEYLYSRLGSKAIQEWYLGYASQEQTELFNYLQHKKDYPLDLILESKLVNEPRNYPGNYYDVFKYRIMFPITDIHGKIIAFAGRTLDKNDDFKYMNNAETTLYQKGRVLYGMNKAASEIRMGGEVIVMEGYLDVIAAHENRIDNCVATCGTSLTESHIKILGGMAKKIIICFDADSAGIASTERSGKAALSQGIPIRVMTLDKDKDPHDILKEEGGYDKFMQLKEQNTGLLEFALNTRGLRGIKNPDERYKQTQGLYEIIDAAKSPLQKALWLKDIAKELELNPINLFKEYQLHLNKLKRGSERAREKPIEDYVLGFLAANPLHRKSARSRFTREDFSTHLKGWFFEFICSSTKEDDIIIKKDLHTHHGPLYKKSERTNLIEEFKRFYQEKNPFTNKEEEIIPVHENQISELEVILIKCANDNHAVLEMMEKELLAEELRELDQEIKDASKKGSVDPDLIELYDEKLEKYNSLKEFKTKR